MPIRTTALNTGWVNHTYFVCVFRNDDNLKHMIEVDGIDDTAKFHARRLEFHESLIHDMLIELPDTFKISHGHDDGASIVRAALDNSGRHWTDNIRTLEKVAQLGVAIGEAEFTRPREVWDSFEDGIPHVRIKL